jgi:hypothetical protein
MRDAQTLTVDQHAALFEYCDIFIDTDDDAWTLIVANPKARAVVDALIDAPINWHVGKPLHEWWTCAPPDWCAVDLNFHKLEQEGRLSRLPKLGDVGTDTHRYTLQVGIAAKKAGLRVVMYDEKAGWQTINLQDSDNVIDFASAHETITRHRLKKDSSLSSNGETQSLQLNPSGSLIDQKVTLPGLPGGPPLVPSLPAVSFENGRLSGGADVLERIIRNDKAEVVSINGGGKEPPAFAPKPKPEFPSGLPLFELSPSICRTLSSDDRAKMIADMIECDCLHLPFPDGIAVRFWLPDIRPGAPEFFVTFAAYGKLALHPLDPSVVTPGSMAEFIETKNRHSVHMHQLAHDGRADRKLLDIQPEKISNKGDGDLTLDCLDALTTLLISLATRNEVKTTEHNTRIKNKHKQSKPQFIGPLGAIYISTTRVEAPAIEDMEQEREPGSHASPRPHRRRGHKHTVRYGVGRRESRVQWFPAVWVNGDPDYTPRKYVVQS